VADPHPAEVTWRKSSRSMSGESNCVEIAVVDGEVWMRDSKSPDNGVIRFTPESWTSFIDAVKADLLPVPLVNPGQGC